MNIRRVCLTAALVMGFLAAPIGQSILKASSNCGLESSPSGADIFEERDPVNKDQLNVRVSFTSCTGMSIGSITIKDGTGSVVEYKSKPDSYDYWWNSSTLEQKVLSSKTERLFYNFRGLKTGKYTISVNGFREQSGSARSVPITTYGPISWTSNSPVNAGSTSIPKPTRTRITIPRGNAGPVYAQPKPLNTNTTIAPTTTAPTTTRVTTAPTTTRATTRVTNSTTPQTAVVSGKGREAALAMCNRLPKSQQSGCIAAAGITPPTTTTTTRATTAPTTTSAPTTTRATTAPSTTTAPTTTRATTAPSTTTAPSPTTTRATVAPTTTAGIRAPGAPQNLMNSVSGSDITLSWNPPIDNGGSAITDYVIEYWAKGGSSWTRVEDGKTTSTSTIIRSLANNIYSFHVAAVNSLGIGSFVETGDVTVGIAPTTTAAPATTTSTSTTTSAASATLMSESFSAASLRGNNPSIIYSVTLRCGIGCTALPTSIAGRICVTGRSFEDITCTGSIMGSTGTSGQKTYTGAFGFGGSPDSLRRSSYLAATINSQVVFVNGLRTIAWTQ